MSTSLDDIWSQPLVNSPSPSTTRPSTAARRVDDEDDENALRPTKRRRSTLFLGGSDDEDQEIEAKPSARKDQSRPDIDALFEDLEEPPRTARQGSSSRRDKQVPSSSQSRYAVQSSSPPRDVLDELGKIGPLADDDSGANTRRQLPKLNEDRLLGKDGFPVLVQACKNFKPKGKGHELADLNRLFSMYQFWAHKMYPKTQFSDTVNRVEKLCHSKRMHSALLGWRDTFYGTINGRNVPQDDTDMHSDDDGAGSGDEERRQRVEDVFGPREENPVSSQYAGSSSGASSEISEPPISRPPSSASTPGEDAAMADDDDPFDFDALLQHEQEMRREEAAATTTASGVKTKGGSAGRDFMFDEDEEAMWAELHDKAFGDDSIPATTSAPPNHQSEIAQNARVPSSFNDNNAWDMFDEMEEQQTRSTPGTLAGHSNDPSEASTESVQSLPTPGAESGSPKSAPNQATLEKSINSNIDDDWDDMYV